MQKQLVAVATEPGSGPSIGSAAVASGRRAIKPAVLPHAVYRPLALPTLVNHRLRWLQRCRDAT